jgi:hypothetical protein
MLFRPPNSLISFRDVYERRKSLAPLGGIDFSSLEKALKIWHSLEGALSDWKCDGISCWKIQL